MQGSSTDITKSIVNAGNQHYDKNRINCHDAHPKRCDKQLPEQHEWVNQQDNKILPVCIYIYIYLFIYLYLFIFIYIYDALPPEAPASRAPEKIPQWRPWSWQEDRKIRVATGSTESQVVATSETAVLRLYT